MIFKLLTSRECRIVSGALKGEADRLHAQARHWRTSDAESAAMRQQADEMWAIAKKLER